MFRLQMQQARDQCDLADAIYSPISMDQEPNNQLVLEPGISHMPYEPVTPPRVEEAAAADLAQQVSLQMEVKQLRSRMDQLNINVICRDLQLAKHIFNNRKAPLGGPRQLPNAPREPPKVQSASKAPQLAELKPEQIPEVHRFEYDGNEEALGFHDNDPSDIMRILQDR
jgi:hypothetical protein